MGGGIAGYAWNQNFTGEEPQVSQNRENAWKEAHGTTVWKENVWKQEPDWTPPSTCKGLQLSLAP